MKDLTFVRIRAAVIVDVASEYVQRSEQFSPLKICNKIYLIHILRKIIKYYGCVWCKIKFYQQIY
jgi:hypothetical protein